MLIDGCPRVIYDEVETRRTLLHGAIEQFQGSLGITGAVIPPAEIAERVGSLGIVGMRLEVVPQFVGARVFAIEELKSGERVESFGGDGGGGSHPVAKCAGGGSTIAAGKCVGVGANVVFVGRLQAQ